MKRLRYLGELAAAVLAGHLPNMTLPVAAKYELPDGRKIKATPYYGEKKADVILIEDEYFNNKNVFPLVQGLLNEKSFITERKKGGTVHKLEWTIE